MLATLTLPAGLDLPAPRRSPIVRVRSADELRTAVRQSREGALTLDASGLDRVLRADLARGLLEVQAATSWGELSDCLARQGAALDAFAGSRRLPPTVGEAASAASPGPDGLPVPAHVVAATLVTPDGELRRASRDANPQLLRLALGGHGVLGVLYSLTFSIDSLRHSAGNSIAPVELDLAGTAPAEGSAWACECLLPPDALDAYLVDARALLEERRLPLLGISVRRYLPEESCRLNWATREWAGAEIRFGVKATLGASVVAAQLRRALIGAACARGGSFPIGDARDATREQLRACYPLLGEFLAEKRRADPAERLQNEWYRAVCAKMRRETCNVRWTRDEAESALSGD
ncbi:MAG: FAD-binding oxidoreductase [Burkholderiales bacterium]|nr:FAD-binding oxidoreductase [Burkholderiales bacterium]